MRYHYRTQRMPIINGKIEQHSITEEHYLSVEKPTRVSKEQQFKEGDELYIEVMDKFVEVTFLSDGYFA